MRDADLWRKTGNDTRVIGPVPVEQALAQCSDAGIGVVERQPASSSLAMASAWLGGSSAACGNHWTAVTPGRLVSASLENLSAV